MTLRRQATAKVPPNRRWCRPRLSASRIGLRICPKKATAASASRQQPFLHHKKQISDFVWLVRGGWLRLRSCGRVKLRLLRGPLERRCGSSAARDDLLDGVEVSGADEALVFHRFVAVLALLPEFLFLELAVGRHAAGLVFARQIEHAHIERVEPGESDELEAIAHRAEFLLEFRGSGVVESLLPVERRRAIVGQKLAGKLAVNAFGKFTGFVEVRR